MHDGSIEQHDTPDRIYVSPASRWVADFVGEANLIRATATGDTADSALGPLTLQAAEGRSVEGGSVEGGSVEVLVRPEQIELLVPEDGARTGAGMGTIDLVEYYGHDHVSIVRLDDGTSVRSRASGPPRFGRGQRVAVRAATSPMPSFVDG
jgi:ABC-type Fe3+/spermidine/putrescine transport system ATPase subunit